MKLPYGWSSIFLILTMQDCTQGGLIEPPFNHIYVYIIIIQVYIYSKQREVLTQGSVRTISYLKFEKVALD